MTTRMAPEDRHHGGGDLASAFVTIKNGRTQAPARASGYASEARRSPRTSPVLERRRRWERRYRLNLWVSDALIVIAFCVLSTVLRLQLLDPTLIAEDPGIIARIPLITSLGWLVALSAFGTRDSELFGSGVTEYTRVAQATGFAFGLLAIAFIVFQWPGLRTQLLISLPFGLLVLLATRWLWRRWLLRRRKFGEYVSRAFVVGAHDEVAFVLRRLGPTWALGYQVVGASLSDRSVAAIAVDGQAYPVVGSIHDAAATAHRLGADAIIVASQPDEDPDFVQRLSQQMVGTAAELVIGGRLADVAGPRISLRPLEGLPLIQVKIPTFEGGAHVVKRAFDLVVSSLALLLIAPVSLVMALAIKISDGGPVFYRQKRVGRDGREFDMLKFRSMRVGADAERALLQAQNDGSGPLFKMRDDPRVTRLGRALRKHSLDELPQFWNVFVGDMSVVGPRPPLPSEVTTYDGRVYRRLYIKPGITGPWQVGGRSNLSWDESVRLDLHYVENWSLLDDLRIMWRTVGVMLKPEGAY
ncbi:MAG TPA: sugar transferase [Propioniciclava sp.]|jgi:exopolysaccharide biosynthesis polyprenyl glycosylphosphotransferase|uniref:sugar transferase n=1 Tax=Propioniciclava sp. TaxID=2038686 RepID=UPI002C4DF80E|nr:sugar transferase [Propioniciclava sp.]HRL48584.1 sugar transferase [Propioniciclava sp.]HRL81556.1 sugar transferase [Propioniciclava sp.]